MEQVIRDHNLVLITASSEEDPAREQDLVLELGQRRAVGLIIAPTALDHTFVQNEIDLGLAVTLLDRPAPGLSGDTVLLDVMPRRDLAARILAVHDQLAHANSRRHHPALSGRIRSSRATVFVAWRPRVLADGSGLARITTTYRPTCCSAHTTAKLIAAATAVVSALFIGRAIGMLNAFVGVHLASGHLTPW